MVTAQERLKVLEMLEAGKISSDDAAKLLLAVGEERGEPTVGGGRWLTIKVTKGGKPEVNVRIPLAVADWALRLIPSKYLEKEGIDADELRAFIQEVKRTGQQQLVDIQTEEDQVQVQIAIE